MGAYLLDVNLLVALTWPDHLLHESAQRWFATRAEQWATSTVTETGFVRVSMNRNVVTNAASWPDALEMLATMRETPGHERWSTDVDLLASPLARRAPIMGHRQVTDVHLAALAADRGAQLATLDRGVVDALHPDDRDVVEVIASR